LFTWLAIRFGVGKLPIGLNWWAVTGGGFLAGIGFTMSLFISRLSLGSDSDVDAAKAGILVASVISAVIGSILLIRNGSATKKHQVTEPPD